MDMVPRGEKGRPCGESHGKAKYSDQQVDDMRDDYEIKKMRASEICKKYNIPKATASMILAYKRRAVTPTAWKPKKIKREEVVNNGQ